MNAATPKDRNTFMSHLRGVALQNSSECHPVATQQYRYLKPYYRIASIHFVVSQQGIKELSPEFVSTIFKLYTLLHASKDLKEDPTEEERSAHKIIGLDNLRICQILLKRLALMLQTYEKINGQDHSWTYYSIKIFEATTLVVYKKAATDRSESSPSLEAIKDSLLEGFRIFFKKKNVNLPLGFPDTLYLDS